MANETQKTLASFGVVPVDQPCVSLQMVASIKTIEKLLVNRRKVFNKSTSRKAVGKDRQKTVPIRARKEKPKSRGKKKKAQIQMLDFQIPWLQVSTKSRTKSRNLLFDA
ncbi:hypothetical protein OSB04_029302 [Centaurea solstitialis]|uniref:Uncharacterized protein n=1 Tax=Centaurea solstitialis TaxID=347529 RepID=A0AA38WC05_9ASTR|nr:hypothetical protein OSB04_029302 [Centaurea solstitialis]